MAGMPGMTNEPVNQPKGSAKQPSDKGAPGMPDMPGTEAKKQ
jgi:hypothetical protein